jgi:glycosyltransferase involved in cell wall biosynthesis
MKVSVAVITYNQQDTIAQTLDSILCQKGNFDLEVVVGEDCSPDETFAICQDYANRYPDIIRLLSDAHNLGIMANSARVFHACTGDFVNIIAGDDYWCDDHKLQKQLDYFKSHPECGMVSTAGYKLLVRENRLIPNAVAPIHPIEDGDVKPFYFSSGYNGGVYAMPLSILIKKEILDKVDFDEFVRRGFPVEDFPMQAVMSQYAKWGHIPDLTVVYRVYQGSASFVPVDHPKYLWYHKGLMSVRRYLNEMFPQDACFTEEMMQEYVFYKEFLLYLHKRQLNDARNLVAKYADVIPDSAKLKQARKMTASKLRFEAFALYKAMIYKRELRKST